MNRGRWGVSGILAAYLCIALWCTPALGERPAVPETPLAWTSSSSPFGDASSLPARALALLRPLENGGTISGRPLVGGELSATALLNEIQDKRDLYPPEQLVHLRRFLERPTDLDQTYETLEHFRIHYATSGPDAPAAWPDPAYVEAVAAACERAWVVYHRDQQWQTPPTDGDLGGDERVDVYLIDLGPGVFGYALHEDPSDAGLRGKSGFIVIDNDCRGHGEVDALVSAGVTLAHEYHHLIQFSFGYDAEATWFMEQTATMEEAEVYPDLDHLSRYLPIYTSHPYRSLDLCNGSAEYGTWLWPRFLVDRPGFGWSLLREVWATWDGGRIPILDALDRACRSHGGVSLVEAFAEWASWNVFLGRRAWEGSSFSYPRAQQYAATIQPEISIRQYPVKALHPDPTRQPFPLGASFVEFQPQVSSADDTLHIRLEACASSGGVRLMVWPGGSRAPVVTTVALTGAAQTIAIPDWDTLERAWLVITNGRDAAETCDYRISAETSYRSADVSETPRATSFGLRGKPNPFEPFTVISFDLPEPTRATLQVFDAQGRLVRTLIDGAVSAGPHGLYWDGSHAGGEQPAAGVYYVRMKTAAGSQQLRLIRVR